MRTLVYVCGLAAVLAAAAPASAQPTFVNGIRLAGNLADATGGTGANEGRFGFFSDLYYDPAHEEWWALSDRGAGGGTLPYETRLSRIALDVDAVTGAISNFRVVETIRFTDPKGLLYPGGGSTALDGLNPGALNGHPGLLGRSFDPEGLVVHPRNRHFFVADEYGPSVYEFDRKGRLVRVFETPANLLPTKNGALDFVALRDDGANGGRQDNRGYEGLAISPDGDTLYAILQDPLIDEPGPNNGRNGRNLRIVVFDNRKGSRTYGTSTAQFVYQLEPQADVRARILAAGGTATATDPRQGRNIGASAIVAINATQFMVLERDNRGIGIDDPAGANVVGSKQVFTIDITGATDVTAIALPGDGNLAAAGIVPVSKSARFIDLAANTLLPNGKKAEKWEGLTIGPRLVGGRHVIVAGNDNDYSVTQNGSFVQFDVYVNFAGGSVQRDLDSKTTLDGVEVGPVPAGYELLPGVLHAYRASKADLAGYVAPPYAHAHKHEKRNGDDQGEDEP